MKLFKKMFGTQPKKIATYESNTLADINESPDLRAERVEEIEESTPHPKVVAVKKTVKVTQKNKASKATTPEKAKAGETKSTTKSAKIQTFPLLKRQHL